MAPPVDAALRVDEPHVRAQQTMPIGSWHLVRPIGQGQWTTAYQARPRQCAGEGPCDYVVKMIRSERREDALARSVLQREAEVAQAVSHPHLTTVLESHVYEPPFYLVLPHLEGLSLSEMLEQLQASGGQTMLLPQALWITRQVAEALQSLHAAGWAHGDVKPANVIVSPAGHATLIDLGLARSINGARSQPRNALCGTLGYMPPEMFGCGSRCDGQSDIYSLGVMLYQLLTGSLPFDSHEPHALASAQLQQRPREPRTLAPHLPPRLTRLLMKMLAKQPLRRPTATELISQLVELEIATFDER